MIDGVLVSTGGASNSVTLYYGQTDGNETIINWNFSKSLGANHNQGVISAVLSGLNSGETYYYRFESNNGVHSSWSNLGSFSTLYYDQGTLRFNTGLNEDGTGREYLWDKNGSGEVKVKDANISLVNYIAPDGSSWILGKSIFHFTDDFYLGPNLDRVILEGVNALSIKSDKSIRVSKNLIGSQAITSGHISQGTLQDGYDSYYGDDPVKGLRLGKGSLGGFGGAQGPGKGMSLGSYWCRRIEWRRWFFCRRRWSGCFGSGRNYLWIRRSEFINGGLRRRNG